MEIDQQTVLKYLALFGLIASIFLLVNFQFIFAVVVLIIVLVSWFLSKKDSAL